MISDFARSLKENIEASGMEIGQSIEVGDPEYWIPSEELEELLRDRLIGKDLRGLALKTRSKIVKQEVCKSLGYAVPSSFRRTRPRFIGQNFDVYSQKSNNLQIYNDDIPPSRRYVLIRVSTEEFITNIKVCTGETIALLDKTGTLTKKHQARLVGSERNVVIFSEHDTDYLQDIMGEFSGFDEQTSPIFYPEVNEIMSIEEAFCKLNSIVGMKIPYSGALNERLHGGVLHQLACEALGYSNFRDNGRFPDIRHQLIEVKLQTSPTIDLGVYIPSSQESLDIPFLNDQPIRVSDVRYAIFCGDVVDKEIIITNLYLVTGEEFFNYFIQTRGIVVNQKLQIPLPAGFL